MCSSQMNHPDSGEKVQSTRSSEEPRTVAPRRRVLVVAYACNPYRGSEHGVGWGWVKMISASNTVHVIVAEFERADIEKWLNAHPEYRGRMHFHSPKHKHWHYSNESSSWVAIENSPLKPVMNVAYSAWQRAAYRLATKLQQEAPFDLCHLCTYVGFRFPGRFYKLSCPFIWGPIGGLENTPRHLLAAMGFKGAMYFGVRNIINSLQKRFLRGPRKAFTRTEMNGHAIAATSSIQREISSCYNARSTVICEIGPPPLVDNVLGSSVRHEGDPLRITWSGIHQPGKALPLLLAALGRLQDKICWELDVLGDGPSHDNWVKRAQSLGLSDQVHWHGSVSRSEAIATVRESHLFVITSLKDLTSSVLLEALSLGVPTVAPDHCGFSDVIVDSCGMKINIDDLESFVSQLAASIEEIYQDEPRRRALARGALKRSAEFSWKKKALDLELVYSSCIYSTS